MSRLDDLRANSFTQLERCSGLVVVILLAVIAVTTVAILFYDWVVEPFWDWVARRWPD